MDSIEFPVLSVLILHFFLCVAPFGCDKPVNGGTITFLGKIWVNFPFSPVIGGRGNESKHRVLKLRHTPNCS